MGKAKGPGASWPAGSVDRIIVISCSMLSLQNIHATQIGSGSAKARRQMSAAHAIRLRHGVSDAWGRRYEGEGQSSLVVR